MGAGCPIPSQNSVVVAKAATVRPIVTPQGCAANRENPQTGIEESTMPNREQRSWHEKSPATNARCRPANPGQCAWKPSCTPRSRPEGRRRTLLPGQPFGMMNTISEPRCNDLHRARIPHGTTHGCSEKSQKATNSDFGRSKPAGCSCHRIGRAVRRSHCDANGCGAGSAKVCRWHWLFGRRPRSGQSPLGGIAG